MPTATELALRPLDLAIVAGYFALLIGIGIYHSRRQRDLNEYFLAGRDVRWVPLGLSLIAALNSGVDYVMQPGAMIKFGACILIASLTWLVICPYVFFVTLPMYRRLGVVTAYEYLERRFDRRVRHLAERVMTIVEGPNSGPDDPYSGVNFAERDFDGYPSRRRGQNCVPAWLARRRAPSGLPLSRRFSGFAAGMVAGFLFHQ